VFIEPFVHSAPTPTDRAVMSPFTGRDNAMKDAIYFTRISRITRCCRGDFFPDAVGRAKNSGTDPNSLKNKCFVKFFLDRAWGAIYVPITLLFPITKQ
jgi:hypothetical protein